MRLLDGDDVDVLAQSAVGLAAARTAARLAAAGGCSTGRVQIGDHRAWMRVLAGILPESGLIGYKEFHRVGKRVRYHISLFELENGDAVGIVDGRRITSLRTASTAALAFRHAFGDRPVSIGIVGSGEEATEGLRAIAGAVTVEGARVFSPTPANREAYASAMASELAIPIEPAGSVEQALVGADAAFVATAAREPVVSYGHVSELEFVAAVGATRPDHHELSGDVIAGARQVIVDCADALEEPGDMHDAPRFGWDPSTARLLGDWLAEPPDARSGLVLFKSIGSVEQDLVLAHQLLVAAESSGVGRVVEEIGSLRIMR
jgi:alanine dehydrogenase